MPGATFTHVVSYLTVFAQLATLVLAVLYVRDRRAGRRSALTAWVSRNGLWLAGVVALAATAGSLTYSDVIGFEPCTLCWYQRICMYPMVLILGMAAWFRDRKVVRYALGLCLVGGLIALDHVWLQMGGTSLIPCAANGPTCDIRFVYEWGYVTIPMMALSAFAFIASILAHVPELPKRR